MNRRMWATILATHVAGAIGGYCATRIGLPLPWLIGALVAVGGMTLFGVPTTAWRPLRDGAMLVLLTGIGLTFTPGAAWITIKMFPVIILAAVVTIALGCAAVPLLARIGRIDRVTAFFCSVPGGPAEMSLLGAQFGATPAPIAISQLIRIVTIVLIIPPALSFAGVFGDYSSSFPDAHFNIWGLIATLSLAVIVSLALLHLKLTSAFLLGPLIVGIGLGVSDVQISTVPTSLMMAAQVLIGSYLGAQFRPDTMRAMRRFLPAAILNVAILTSGCALFGWLLHFYDGEAAATMILATAPGSVTEMSITAQALGFNVPVVTAFHVLRIFLVILATPLAFAAMRACGLVKPTTKDIKLEEPAE